ncbi:MAG: hypothetical protein LBS52_03435 [Dysgonamonadaceae bacterium]|nr:hypothetical protein [Dysgonamonadaceae bacterium]
MKKITFFFAGLLLLSSCSTDEFGGGKSSDGKVKLSVELNVNPMSSSTRAMTADDEKKITSLVVLVFSRLPPDTGDGTLEYIAENTPVTDDGKTTIQIKSSFAGGGVEYNIMFVANTSINFSSYIGQSRATVQAAASFTRTGGQPWAARLGGSSTAAPIPMWGETGFKTINHDGSTLTGSNAITMIRAMARFDVGIKYSSGSFQGLSGYQLEEVHVYRSATNALIIPAPLSYNPLNRSIIATSVPASPTFDALGVSGSASEGVKYIAGAPYTSSVREIYVMERQTGTTAPMDECTAIVVKIKNTSTNKSGYYRMNIDLDGDGIPNNVLRNHYYIFNIGGVSGEGMDNPEAALNSIVSDLQYTVVEWDLATTQVWMTGNYYLRVSKPKVTLSNRANNGEVTLDFETNALPNPDDECFTIKWKDAPAGSPVENIVAKLDGTSSQVPLPSSGDALAPAAGSGTLTFHAPINSYTGEEIASELIFTAGDICVKVPVVQPEFVFDYTFDCDDIKASGSYMVNGTPNVDKDIITIGIHNITPDMEGLTWEIHTDVIYDLSFSGTGQFGPEAYQEVTLTVDDPTTVILTPPGTRNYTLTSNSTAGGPDSPFPANCNQVKIVVGFTTKKVFLYGDITNGLSAPQTSMISDPYTYSYIYPTYTEAYTHSYHRDYEAFRFLTSNVNFSYGGTVPIEGFEFTHMHFNDVTSDRRTQFFKKVEDERPDILLIADDDDDVGMLAANDEALEKLYQYVDQGGVLILIANDPHTNPVRLYNNLFNYAESPFVDATQQSKNQVVYMPNNNHKHEQFIHESGDALIKNIPGDPIVTGVIDGVQFFPSIAGKQLAVNEEPISYNQSGEWCGYGFKVQPGATDVIVYATAAGTIKGADVSVPMGEHAIMIRHKRKNVIMFTNDCGFLASRGTTTAPTNKTPFQLNNDGSPKEANPYDLEHSNGTSANSLIFANVMAWAIYQAQFQGINSGGIPADGEE